MLPGELKPILATLVLPPAGPLLLALLGLLLAWRRRGAGLALAFLAVLSLAALSTHAVALLLARALLPQVAPLDAAQLQRVQAIVVLGGGVLPQAPEYGSPQLAEASLMRLRYGAWLARRSGKPLALAGGIGWGGGAGQREGEASVARRVLQEDWGLAARWVDDRSRDTRENARRMAAQLLPAGVRRVALVTDATHLPRATAQFRAAGFEVVPAPTHYPLPRGRALLEWLPSAQGLMTSRTVLREWLALQLL